jgi:hypothetical protein
VNSRNCRKLQEPYGALRKQFITAARVSLDG